MLLACVDVDAKLPAPRLPPTDLPSIFNCATAGVCAVHPNRPPPAQDPPAQPAAAPPAGPGAAGALACAMFVTLHHLVGQTCSALPCLMALTLTSEPYGITCLCWGLLLVPGCAALGAAAGWLGAGQPLPTWTLGALPGPHQLPQVRGLSTSHAAVASRSSAGLHAWALYVRPGQHSRRQLFRTAYACLLADSPPCV